jgi:hypothetical protein
LQIDIAIGIDALLVLITSFNVWFYSCWATTRYGVRRTPQRAAGYPARFALRAAEMISCTIAEQ